MKFSVIVPMYNVQEFLSQSIESVLNQTYSNFELILVNDGSKDSTLEIANKYKEKDSRIIVINQTNKGLVIARRVAIDKAIGDYIVILDSDDLLNLDMLEILKETIEKTNSDLLLYKYNNIDIEGKVWKKEKHILEGKSVNKELVLKLFLSNSYLHNIWGKCFKSNLLKDDFIDYNKVGHLNMSEDRLQSIYGLYHCRNLCFIDKYLYNYRSNPKSLTNTFNKKGLYDSIKVYKTMNEYYNKTLLTNEQYVGMIAEHALQTIGKYLRWVSLNDVSKEEKVETLSELIDLDYVIEASDYIKGFKNKIIYKSFIKRKQFRLTFLIFLNKIRINKKK